MWELSQPWWQFVLRGVIVYAFVFILLRVVGKKQIGQLTPFDLVLLLIISNAVQNSMNAGDNSITAGLILASTLILMNLLMDILIFKSRTVEKIMEGHPKILARHGKMLSQVMEQQRVTRQDLETAVREAGVRDISGVDLAILEANGQISILKKEKSD